MLEHIKKMVDEINEGKSQLFDVREQDEWDAGHLGLATLLPLSEIKQGKIDALGDKNKKTYLHCRSGGRVKQAEPLLKDLGVNDIVALSEGYQALVSEGLK